MQSIATERLHDVTQWTTLARLNHLDFPYIVKTEHDKAAGIRNKDVNGYPEPKHWLTYGDELKLPITNNPGNDYLSNTSRNQNLHKHIYDSTLGMDLGLSFHADPHAPGANYGDQVCFLQGNHRHNDVKIASGVRNLLQSLVMRLVTHRGTLPYHPYYGSYLSDYIGQPISDAPSTCQDISIEIERTINTDRRVHNCSVTSCHIISQNFFAVVTIDPISNQNAFTMYVDSINQEQINAGLLSDNTVSE